MQLMFRGIRHKLIFYIFPLITLLSMVFFYRAEQAQVIRQYGLQRASQQYCFECEKAVEIERIKVMRTIRKRQGEWGRNRKRADYQTVCKECRSHSTKNMLALTFWPALQKTVAVFMGLFFMASIMLYREYAHRR